MTAPDAAAPPFVAVGNCQVDHLRAMLAATPAFAARFAHTPVAPIHEMTAADVESVRAAVGRAGLLLVQPINDDYHSLGLSSASMISATPGRVIRIPSIYYRGVFPFQVGVSRDGRHGDAPITVYHDVRTLYCASRGMSDAAALRWWRGYEPPPGVVRALADESAQEIRRREKEARVDIAIGDRLEDPDVLSGGFFTVNHPSTLVLEEIARQILLAVGLPGAPASPPYELDAIQTPIEPAVAAALGIAPSAEQAWVVDRERWPVEEMLLLQLAHYRADPEIATLGTEQNAALIERLGLAGPARPRADHPVRPRRPRRLAWIVNHSALLASEVPMLRALGYEVYVPKLIPSADPEYRSAATSDLHDASLGLGRGALALLNAHRFYTDPWSPELAALIGREFDAVVVAMSGYVTPLDQAARLFPGAILARAFGREAPETYSSFLASGDPPLATVIGALGERFVFAQGYGNLADVEDEVLRDRAVTIGLPAPGGFSGGPGWDGAGGRAAFLCPSIRETGYYRDIYDAIKRDFGDLPHLIFGRQLTPPDDPAILPYLTDEQLVELYRHAPVLVYPSAEPRHVHYSPIEAMIVGTPVLWRRGGLIDRLAGRGPLPGACADTAEMHAKATALLAGDPALAAAIQKSQPAIVARFSSDVAYEQWDDALRATTAAAGPPPAPRRPPRLWRRGGHDLSIGRNGA